MILWSAKAHFEWTLINYLAKMCQKWPLGMVFLSLKKNYVFSLFLLDYVHFWNKILNSSHIEIMKIKKCNKYVNLLHYKILLYKILRFILLYQEFAIENLNKTHCVFLVLEGLRICAKSLESPQSNKSITIHNLLLQTWSRPIIKS